MYYFANGGKKYVVRWNARVYVWQEKNAAHALIFIAQKSNMMNTFLFLYLFPVVVSALFFVRGARERERKKTTQLRNVCFFFEIAWRFEYRNNIQHFTLAYKMYIEHCTMCTCHFIRKRKSLSNERMEKFGFDLTLWFVICLACDRFMCKFAGEHIFLFTHASH